MVRHINAAMPKKLSKEVSASSLSFLVFSICMIVPTRYLGVKSLSGRPCRMIYDTVE